MCERSSDLERWNGQNDTIQSECGPTVNKVLIIIIRLVPRLGYYYEYYTLKTCMFKQYL